MIDDRLYKNDRRSNDNRLLKIDDRLFTNDNRFKMIDDRLFTNDNCESLFVVFGVPYIDRVLIKELPELGPGISYSCIFPCTSVLR